MRSIPSHRAPRRPSALLAVLTALATLPLSLLAKNLEWQSESQSFETTFTQENVEAVYAFKNVGDSPVTILETHSSCGCTVPSLDKKEYQPGETGELKAIFTIGSRQGMQRKEISVTTQEGDQQQTYTLTLQIDIPVPVQLKPRVRFWSVKEPVATQEIEIELHEQAPMKIDGIRRTHDSEPIAFDWELVTQQEGRAYTLKVIPKSPDEKARDVLYLTSPDDKAGILKNYPIYLYVR